MMKENTRLKAGVFLGRRWADEKNIFEKVASNSFEKRRFMVYCT